MTRYIERGGTDPYRVTNAQNNISNY